MAGPIGPLGPGWQPLWNALKGFPRAENVVRLFFEAIANKNYPLAWKYLKQIETIVQNLPNARQAVARALTNGAKLIMEKFAEIGLEEGALDLLAAAAALAESALTIVIVLLLFVAYAASAAPKVYADEKTPSLKNLKEALKNVPSNLNPVITAKEIARKSKGKFKCLCHLDYLKAHGLAALGGDPAGQQLALSTDFPSSGPLVQPPGRTTHGGGSGRRQDSRPPPPNVCRWPTCRQHINYGTG